MRLDLKAGSEGWRGAIDGVRRVTGDPNREAEDRAAIAAAGPLSDVGGLDAPSARHDRRVIDLWRPDDWSEVEVWRWIALEHARKLARTPECDRLWRQIVVALDELGDVSELSGDEIGAIAADEAEPA